MNAEHCDLKTDDLLDFLRNNNGKLSFDSQNNAFVLEVKDHYVAFEYSRYTAVKAKGSEDLTTGTFLVENKWQEYFGPVMAALTRVL